MENIIAKITSFFAAFSLTVTYILGLGTFGVSDGWRIVDRQKKVGTAAIYAGQGICFDGEYYYTSGSITALNITCLAKWDKNMKRVAKLNKAVPKDFYEQYESDHIGGIDVAGGYIYAPVEGKGYKRNFVLLYDCETLEYTGKYCELTCDALTDGIPWCAVDEENGRLYTSRYSGANEILVYELESMKPLAPVQLSETIDRIQGGSVYNGKIYLSCDTPDSVDENVYEVDLQSGEVKVGFVRNMCNYDNEAEDICVYPFTDGSLFHLLDYDKLLGIMVTSYAPEEG